MADLGPIGELVEQEFSFRVLSWWDPTAPKFASSLEEALLPYFPVGSGHWLLRDRAANPPTGALFHDCDHPAYPFPEDLKDAAGIVEIVGSVNPADYASVSVVVFDWFTKVVHGVVSPSQTGEWSARVPSGAYGCTLVKDGFKPVTHGPYVV